jgi:hypothetical protein
VEVLMTRGSVVLALMALSGCYLEFGDGETPFRPGSGPEDNTLGIRAGELRGDVADVTDVGGPVGLGSFGDEGFTHVSLDVRGTGGAAMVMLSLYPPGGTLEPGARFALSTEDGSFHDAPPAMAIACSGPEAYSWTYDAPLQEGEVTVEAGASDNERVIRFRGTLDTGQEVTGSFRMDAPTPAR